MSLEVRDAAGAMVPGAAVVSVEGTVLTVSDADGRACVAPSQRVRVEVPGLGSADVAATTGPVSVVLSPNFSADVEVAAERRDARLRDAPVRTEVVSRDFVEQVGARTLADAVEYTTGVRVENNCQNCNFSQVRLLGLEGPYTQILMDGQPTLSSLAQVYGLEQIPARLIDRIEVTKGGGAALLGPGSVGGVINVVTREPATRGYQVDTTVGTAGGTPLTSTSAALDWVSADKRGLVTAYGQADRVSAIDLTGDGYTEVSRRALEAGGVRGHRVLLDNRARITLDASAMHEDRRGGNALDLPPHEADVAEAIDTRREAATLTWLHAPTPRSDYRLTVSAADTRRDSYYGVGRDPLAYGDTRSRLGVADLLINRYATRHVVSGGAQVTLERLQDSQPGYGRALDLRYQQVGAFVQDEWTFRPGWQVLTGVRVDRHSALSRAQVLPRAALRASPRPFLDLRVSYAQGIRAPQVFDEDLHIASVGGEARVVVVDPALRPERSTNWMAGAEWKPTLWGGQALLEANAFHTRLRDQFHLQEDDLPDTGVHEFRKVNLGTATVRGVEANLGWGRGDHLVLQGGFVLQRSTFGQPDPDFGSTRFFRTPDVYGNASITLKELLPVDLFAGLRVTGPMLAPHFAGAIPEDRLERTPSFVQVDVSASRRLTSMLALTLAVRNLTNAYQRDLDQGPLRDSAYVYGPRFPRTVQLSLRVGR
ncbi:TonB-dependent receptor [Luteitalea sp. TBR-22]|uniref:TonB-dependent receptor plug domain-containing protein n=1 Tax=Luteitalea sp. TBR-22 TaxID=2802971 RepID=UPI001AF4A8F1|nr:TonB-dependent receptor [Luteitalea sp. TBR-22]BCS34002.1 TonB-dependent receptor [Luteitalea sp. TBR-22]